MSETHLQALEAERPTSPRPQVAAPQATAPVRLTGCVQRMPSSSLLALQRTAGNVAVTRLLQRCGSSGCACGGRCGGGQKAKLTMSRPEDLAELEADEVGR